MNENPIRRIEDDPLAKLLAESLRRVMRGDPMYCHCKKKCKHICQCPTATFEKRRGKIR